MRPIRRWGWAAVVLAGGLSIALGQDTVSAPQLAAPAAGEKALPINLATALQLANARSLDVAVAAERVRQAAAQYERAQVLWLPSIQFGVDYFRHDGRIQT